ncbi:ligand of Numb protein X 2-like isoform X2 [Tigriopus californicus]|uniref:ligand of Numb protein X 2-like isoform X2 n=1 Tax=Tigriopus californicus TaxID=6832 RepID=UPI0027D9EB78|nr:ligand of Numb protein X 2-like isoform X2 [Tigriopus californicus]
MNQFFLSDQLYWSKYDHADCNPQELQINVISDGITRLPILEGEVSHIEIPRTRPSLGMTIVGGSDTPLRCVVVQEIYPDGLMAQDGRLRPGDQIIEINGIDMTRANHSQVCTCLRKMGSVLRLGIYRERIEKYSVEVSKRPPREMMSKATTSLASSSSSSSSFSSNTTTTNTTTIAYTATGPSLGGRGVTPSACSSASSQSSSKVPPTPPRSEELLTITLERETSKQLGIRLSGKCSMPGVYIVDIQDGSTAALDGRIQKFDRLMFINGQDVRHVGLVQATALIQNNDKVSLVVGRSPHTHLYLKDLEHPDGDEDAISNCSAKEFTHTRSKSAPAINQSHLSKNELGFGHTIGDEHDDDDDDDDDDDELDGDMDSDGYETDKSDLRPSTAGEAPNRDPYSRPSSLEQSDCRGISSEHLYDNLSQPWDPLDKKRIQKDDDYMAIYETIDRALSRKEQLKDVKKAKSQSMEALETPTPSVKSFEFPSAEVSFHKGPHNEGLAVEGRCYNIAMKYATKQKETASPHSQHNAGSAANGATTNCSKRKGSPKEENNLSNDKALAKSNVSISATKQDSGTSSNGSIGPSLAFSSVAASSKSDNLHHAGPSGTSDDRGRKVISTNGFHANANEASSNSMSLFLRRALKQPQEVRSLQERLVKITKNARESLGMRIGGGIGSNEGDTPIYVANIHPHGCIGKSKLLKKGDVLLSVDNVSLFGLTHAQAVTALKATISRSQVALGVMDGPETSYGASNFIPSWMFWQKLPRSLQYPKTVILHRKEHRSWGFSIVGGAKDEHSLEIEPIHVLFVVPGSPAAKDAKIKCGDRLLAVDGTSLDSIDHSLAVTMLKQTSTRVLLEVVSWLGTEL